MSTVGHDGWNNANNVLLVGKLNKNGWIYSVHRETLKSSKAKLHTNILIKEDDLLFSYTFLRRRAV